MINFKDDPELGLTVIKANPISQFADPIRNLNDIKIASGNDMFSRVCGFAFTSALPKTVCQYPQFFLLYVAKKASNIHGNQPQGFSRWFIIKPINYGIQWQVLSKEDCFNVYGFNVDKFVESDMWAKYVNSGLFQRIIKKGITLIKDFLSKTKLTPDDMSMLKTWRWEKTLSDAADAIANAPIEDKFYLLSKTRPNGR